MSYPLRSTRSTAQVSLSSTTMKKTATTITAASSSLDITDDEHRFFKEMEEVFGKKQVTSLKKRRFLKHHVDWYTLHKLANKHRYVQVKTVKEKDVEENKRRFLEIGKEYISTVKELYIPQNCLPYISLLQLSYDNSHINEFLFNHDSNGEFNQNEASESNSNAITFYDQVELELKPIERAYQTNRKRGNRINEHTDAIRRLLRGNSHNNASTQNNKVVVLFGRSGNGKSSLLNLCLFCETRSVSQKEYKKQNEKNHPENFASIQFCSTLIGQDDVMAFQTAFIDSWKHVLDHKNGNQEEDDELGYKGYFNIMDVGDLVNKKGEWKVRKEYEDEVKELSMLTQGDDKMMNGMFKPFLLNSPDGGVRKSCTAHVTPVHFGLKYEAVIVYYPLEDLLKRFDPGNANDQDKKYLWRTLVSLETESVEDEYGYSQSKKAKVDVPENAEEASMQLSESVKQFFATYRGSIISGFGEDPIVDRMIVRQKVKYELERLHQIIMDVHYFVPAKFLQQHRITLVDAPGDDDSNPIKRLQTERAISMADAAILVSKRELECGTNLKSFLKAFLGKIIGSNSNYPVYVLMREDKENKSTLDDIKKIRGNRKEDEYDVASDLIKNTLQKISIFGVSDDRERDDIIKKVNHFTIRGGYFFYIWAALRAFGDNMDFPSERLSLLNESRYHDLMDFIKSVGDVNSSNATPETQFEKVLEKIDAIESEMEVKFNEDILNIIKGPKNGFNVEVVKDIFDEMLNKIDFFKSLTNNDKGQRKCEDIKKSNYEPSRRIYNLIVGIATKLKERVKNYICEENANIVKKINGTIEETELKNVFAKESSDVSHGIIFTPFADLVSDFIEKEKIDEIFDTFLQNIVPDFIEYFEEIDEIIEGKFTQLQTPDHNMKNAFEYLSNLVKMPSFKREFEIRTTNKVLENRNPLFRSSLFAVELKKKIKHDYLELLQSQVTKNDLNASRLILDNTIKYVESKELLNSIIEHIQNWINYRMKLLYETYVENDNRPALRCFCGKLSKDPVALLSAEMKVKSKTHLNNLKKIIADAVKEHEQELLKEKFQS